jgi:molybdopterin molybdotransferase
MERPRAAVGRELHGGKGYRVGNDIVVSGFSVCLSWHLDSSGKPTIFAKACGKPILGLPGYPVSALVIFDLFAVPLIRRVGGENRDALEKFSRTTRAVLKTNVASQIGREDYVRVVLERSAAGLVAVPLPSKSGAIFTLVKADGMVRVEMNQDGLEQGEEVEVILF